MADLDARRQKLKDEFIAARGYWSELWDGVLQLSPEFFEAYSAFSSVPWKHGTLPPKIKELIYVAIDASTTHLYNPGHAHPHRQCAEAGRDARRGDGGAARSSRSSASTPCPPACRS